MRKILQTLLICLIAEFSFSQSFPKKQTLIPLNNANGVPFYKDQELSDLAIDGFEIDSKGNFFFMGGDNTNCLAVFAGTKQVLRKNYSKVSAGQLYLYKNGLYTFDKNNYDLTVLNPSNGSLIKRFNHITNKRVNSYTFADSSLILEILKDTTIFYEQYDLAGKSIGKAPNEDNIAPALLPEKDAELLGMWNGNYVFWNLDFSVGDSQVQKFWLVDKTGKILAKRSFPNKGNVFGYIYALNPSEHRKVRNGCIYVLGRSRTGKNALITEVPLSTFFTK